MTYRSTLIMDVHCLITVTIFVTFTLWLRIIACFCLSCLKYIMLSLWIEHHIDRKLLKVAFTFMKIFCHVLSYLMSIFYCICLGPTWSSISVDLCLILSLCCSTSASNSGAYTLLGESCPERARGRSMLLCTCSLMCSQAVVAGM